MLIKPPHIVGMTKIRNESLIINDTLDKWGETCTGGIIVLDELSDDNTDEICRQHDSVIDVIFPKTWDHDREKAEWFNRQMLLDRAMHEADDNTWFVYFDADEHLYDFTDWDMFNSPHIKAIACRLFDFYITPEDINFRYDERQWIGPEFRTIDFFFRKQPGLKYHLPDQRAVTLPDTVGDVPIHGDIKHYGKGFSVKEWEKTCDYYIKFWPKYADKWRRRKGKAVHENMKSDFGNPLIKWKDRNNSKIFALEDQKYGNQ